MKERKNTGMSRRTFLGVGAATTALLAGGIGSFESWQKQQAFASEEADDVKKIATTCNACSNKCGFIAYVKQGRLWKIKGNPEHPKSKGTLCARGHGYSQLLYSPYRLTDPLKNDGSGNFSAISWEQAYQEIAEKVQQILREDGPEALALIEDPRPSGKYYSHRFINALGSNNYFQHSAACNLSILSANLAVLGTTKFSADVANSKFILFIGRSYGDGIEPSANLSLTKARDNGAKVVIVDPRLNNTGTFADQWLPINPGTDLALLLALSHVLVTEELYDKKFVAEQTYGFEEWCALLEEYTPEWAQGITGISAEVIEKLAKDMAAAAPRAVVSPGWRGGFGCQYLNSFETSRAVAAFNALLGNYNKKGGATIASSPKVGSLDAERFPKLPKTPPKAGFEEFPLMDGDPGSNLIVPMYAQEGRMKGVFFYNSNAAMGYANPRVWSEALDKMSLKVCIDVQMSETALLCDYVLPECSYLERDELPDLLGSSQGVACARQKVVDLVNPNTKSADVIYRELAQACGVGEYFPFSQDELIDAQLASLDADIEEYHSKGVTKVGNPVDISKMPKWKTPTQKLQFSSPKNEELGIEPLIHWIEPAVMPKEDEFRLIGGKQAIHSHQMTTSIAALMAITKDYALERALINASRARELGIEDGDLIEISSSESTQQVRCKVTEGLNPSAIWIPTHYGGSSPELKEGYGVGVAHMKMIEFKTEPYVGSAMTHEVTVKVRKVED